MTFISLILVATTSTEARTDLLVELIARNGCEMSGAEATEILPQHDFTREETQEITAALFSEGIVRIDRETDTLVLTTEECR